MRRQEQLAEVLRDIVAAYLVRHVEVPDGTLVSVTRVDMSGNRRHATVRVSVLPDAQTQQELERVRGHIYAIQGEVNRHVSAHPAPRLTIAPDDGPAHTSHIAQLTRDIHDA